MLADIKLPVNTETVRIPSVRLRTPPSTPTREILTSSVFIGSFLEEIRASAVAPTCSPPCELTHPVTLLEPKSDGSGNWKAVRTKLCAD